MPPEGKYFVARADGGSRPGKPHEECSYLVIDLDCDPWARAAVEAILSHTPQGAVADALRVWLRTGVPPVPVQHITLKQAGLTKRKEDDDEPKPKRAARKSILRRRDPKAADKPVGLWDAPTDEAGDD